jgi:hypothetical protein
LQRQYNCGGVEIEIRIVVREWISVVDWLGGGGSV